MPLDFQTRAAIAPQTLNRQARTVDVILSTGAPVRRQGFDGPYLEELEISARAVDLSRMPVSVLDGHSQAGVASILGTLVTARIEAGQLVGTVRISKRHEDLLDDIEAGDVRSLSIGYSAERWEDRPARDGLPVRTLTRWTIHEVSFVPVPADPQATVRSRDMEQDTTGAQTAPQTTGAPPPAPAPDAIQTRAEINREIRALGDTAQLPASWANEQIDRAATLDQARAAAWPAMQARGGVHRPRVTALHQIDNPEAIRAHVSEALFCRANPAQRPGDAARAYMHHTLVDIARDSLTRAGASITGLSPADIFTRAGQHTTSDFPAILGDTMNRTLRAGYEAAPATLKRAARQTTARDFRAKTALQLGEAPALAKVNESGEYTHGPMAEAKESYAIDSYGKIFALSRKAMVNDDLSAFMDIGRKWGMASTEFEGQFLVNLLIANAGLGPIMDDTTALFHEDHGNLAGSGAVLSVTTLSAARLAMRTQKGLSGTPINVTPKFLIVPPALETTAEQLLASIQPTATGDVNPFAGKLELLVEARLPSATRWYVAADPAQVDGLEYAYLQGEEGPQIETRAGFEVDGMEFKVRLDFGAGFLDHRSWFMNPGA